MNRHEFLRRMHRELEPRNYLEVGVNDGRSLTLSKAPSIAIDPAPKVTEAIRCDLQLAKTTSDAFFAGRDPIGHFRSGRNPFRNIGRGRPALGHYLGGNVVDLAFIDGMHLFDYVLRDFMNIERFCGPQSVVVFDDMLPRDVHEAARNRHTNAWTGDVYKMIPVLARYRPDLLAVPVDTEPTGVLAVFGADAESSVLAQHYEEIISDWVVDDPQRVPGELLDRRVAVAPEEFFGSVPWESLRRSRARRGTRSGPPIPGMRTAFRQPVPAGG
jgi:hypothetical protein